MTNLTAYEGRLTRPTRSKIVDFHTNQRLKHVILAEQFDPTLLAHLCRVAMMIRDLARPPDTHRQLGALLSHKRAMLYFTQASTRTFLSFSAACQLLGMPTEEIRDPSTSSEYKGESILDSMRMFSSYFDIVIMRSKIPNLAECCAYLMNDLAMFNDRNVPIVNAGAGADEHPTQALLDIFTIQRTFEFTSPQDSSTWTRYEDLRRQYPTLSRDLNGKVYGFSGDIGRGRTVRSLAMLLAQYKDVTMHFVSPPYSQLQLQPDLRQRLVSRGVQVYEHQDLAKVIPDLDLLYMTRIQSEHDKAGEAVPLDEIRRCFLTQALVDQMRPYAPILHPFPRNDEIPTEIDTDSRAVYFRQARNGMWARAALIAYLFDVDRDIETLHRQAFTETHNYNEAVL